MYEFFDIISIDRTVPNRYRSNVRNRIANIKIKIELINSSAYIDWHTAVWFNCKMLNAIDGKKKQVAIVVGNYLLSIAFTRFTTPQSAHSLHSACNPMRHCHSTSFSTSTSMWIFLSFFACTTCLSLLTSLDATNLSRCNHFKSGWRLRAVCRAIDLQSEANKRRRRRKINFSFWNEWKEKRTQK